MQIDKVLQANDLEDSESQSHDATPSLAQGEQNQQVQEKTKQATKMADDMTNIEKKIEKNKKIKQTLIKKDIGQNKVNLSQKKKSSSTFSLRSD